MADSEITQRNHLRQCCIYNHTMNEFEPCIPASEIALQERVRQYHNQVMNDFERSIASTSIEPTEVTEDTHPSLHKRLRSMEKEINNLRKIIRTFRGCTDLLNACYSSMDIKFQSLKLDVQNQCSCSETCKPTQ